MLLISLSFKQLTRFGVKHYQIQTFYTHNILCTHLSLSSSRPSTIAFLSLTIATSFFISCCSFFLSQDVFRCSAHTNIFQAQISARFSFSSVVHSAQFHPQKSSPGFSISLLSSCSTVGCSSSSSWVLPLHMFENRDDT